MTISSNLDNSKKIDVLVKVVLSDSEKTFSCKVIEELFKKSQKLLEKIF